VDEIWQRLATTLSPFSCSCDNLLHSRKRLSPFLIAAPSERREGQAPRVRWRAPDCCSCPAARSLVAGTAPPDWATLQDDGLVWPTPRSMERAQSSGLSSANEPSARARAPLPRQNDSAVQTGLVRMNEVPERYDWKGRCVAVKPLQDLPDPEWAPSRCECHRLPSRVRRAPDGRFIRATSSSAEPHGHSSRAWIWSRSGRTV
jgi:hypothetical protein